jgi:hypothetical protein
MDSSDLVYHRKDKKVMALGYRINSRLLEQGLPAVGQVGGGGLGDLVVPAGLLLLQQTFMKEGGSKVESPKEEERASHDKAEVVNESLYDKLLALVNYRPNIPKKRLTRRYSKKGRRRTRRRR